MLPAARQIRRLSAMLLLMGCLIPTAVEGQTSSLRSFPDEQTLAQYNLTRRWYAQVPIANIRENILDLKVIEDLLFATSSQGLIHCLNAETGERLWTTTIGSLKREVFPPAVTEDFVYVTSSNLVAQLERTNGRVLWTKRLSSVATSGPGANEDFVYVQTADHKISAIALKPSEEDKRQKWPNVHKFEPHPVSWFYNAGGPMVDPPIVLPELVAFATKEGVVYASALNERKLIYRFFTHSRQAAPLAHLDRFLYIATEEFDVYAIDLLNGYQAWRFVAGYPVYLKPTPFLDDCFVVGEGAGLFCVANQDVPDAGIRKGDLRWRTPHLVRLIGVSKDFVYAANVNHDFVILARSDGHTIARFPAPDFKISSDNQFTDRLYMCTEDGLIVCLHEKNHEAPFAHPQKIDEPTETKEKAKPEDKPKRSGFFDE
ncbi:MAG: PQQ-binding-like beta-propeller repeat protein [Planctomycetota bacterium]